MIGHGWRWVWWVAVAVVIGTGVLAPSPAAAGMEEDIARAVLAEAAARAEALCQSSDTSTGIVPNECWGDIPSSGYDIGCDEGAWNHLSRKVYCVFTDLSFQGARVSTVVALWLISWAYGFGVYETLGDPLIRLSANYETGIIGPLGLTQAVWFAAVAWAAVTALRGRLTMAGGELVISIIAALLAGYLLANPAGYLQGAFDTMRSASAVVLAAGSDQPLPTDASGVEAIVEPLQEQLHDAFVADPHAHINWGKANDEMSPECRQTKDLILVAGPWGSDDLPRTAMKSAGCEAEADWNHDPSATRLFGAVLLFIASLIMVALVGLVAFTVVVAQVVAILLFVLVPFACLAAILPGSGREMAWRWVASLMRVVLVVVGMSAVLSLMLLSIRALLEAPGIGMIERFAIVNLAVVAMFIARKRVISSGAQLAARFGQGFRAGGGGRPGGGGWSSSPAAAGASGFGVAAGLGSNDPPGMARRLAVGRMREHRANARMDHMGQASEKRAEKQAKSVTSRERSEIITNPDGTTSTRRSMSVDGPVATTRRARRTRERVERSAARSTARRYGNPGSGPRRPGGAATPNDTPNRGQGATTPEPTRQPHRTPIGGDNGPRRRRDRRPAPTGGS